MLLLMVGQHFGITFVDAASFLLPTSGVAFLSIPDEPESFVFSAVWSPRSRGARLRHLLPLAGDMRRGKRARLTRRCRASTICSPVCRRVRFKRLLPFCGPKRSRMFALIAFELVGAPKQRAVDYGTIVTGQIDEAGLNHEAAEFDEMTRALAALDLPCAHLWTPRLMQEESFDQVSRRSRGADICPAFGATVICRGPVWEFVDPVQIMSACLESTCATYWFS